ncbi:hypothetical protein M670_00440 [Schinkia azotoformans MEV2011]|uniref:Phage protein n=1 Tax=Schinkia azotoformans MEV2011 TaxID=1348973 RepID=A0A072NRS4_SCHAZ|nr:hypothetical protein [Schinkia azotoformans]KEF40414.1 hypothetical protein M670_00440 [Schinkia azotoformans MEV2011]MEC1696175.1 hypothetical protein [Schinkia azotoformans]MEC1725322.1 hypothetical protein [Schinkia azotoformans]MEC1779433.1 hypothetical protein [Schinkia azotoformans]MED4330082.1 hypothetical protein [Schinkia azotoformans]
MDIRKLMSKAKAAAEFMYNKTATIKRSEEYTKTNGANGMDWVVKYTNVPCRLSSTGMQSVNNTSQGEANVIQYDLKMFLSSEYELKAGDSVIVDGVEFESAKEPFVYISHQEVLMKRKGYA